MTLLNFNHIFSTPTANTAITWLQDTCACVCVCACVCEGIGAGGRQPAHQVLTVAERRS